MGVSKLLAEDDEFLYLQRYIHDDPDETPDWIWDEAYKNYKYSDQVVMADDGVAYELKMTYRIRKSDATVIIDEIA